MEIKVRSNSRNEIIDITEEIRKVVRKEFDEDSNACLVYCPHTTCAVLIQEDYDRDVKTDILEYLSHIPRTGWRHAEGNSDSHIKSSLIGPSKTIPVEKNEILLGRWQGIALCEFDGPRERRILIKKL